MLGLFKRKPELTDDDFASEDDEGLKAFIPREEREATYKEATVIFPSGYSIRGVVVDYSRTGVRLRFQNYEQVPERLWLKVPNLNLSCECRSMWQDTVDVGLQFIRRTPSQD